MLHSILPYIYLMLVRTLNQINIVTSQIQQAEWSFKQIILQNVPYLCTICSSNQTWHFSTQLTGSTDGIECNRGQLVIVVLCNNQGALKPLEETSLLEKLFE